MNLVIFKDLLNNSLFLKYVSWLEKADYIPLNIFDIFWYKLKDISTYGFTIEEFQRAMIILCFVRFIIYSFRYNLVTSCKICSIGLVSCSLWAMALNDCIGAYYPNLSLHPLLRNAYREEIIYREIAQYRAAERIFDDLIKQTNNPYNFDWITPIFARLPHSIINITDPIYVFIRKDLINTLSTIYKTNIKPMSSMFIYIGWVRVGKKYCPYHIRWHFTFITLYNTFIPYLFKSALRARIFLNKVLIPEQRYAEAENLRIYLGAWAFVHINFVMIAMLHAIFSQYFYVPFLTYSVELHVGKRPKDSLYSGGYTAWQDNFTFSNIRLRDILRLWWGFLGKGTKKQRKNQSPKK